MVFYAKKQNKLKKLLITAIIQAMVFMPVFAIDLDYTVDDDWKNETKEIRLPIPVLSQALLYEDHLHKAPIQKRNKTKYPLLSHR